MASKSATEIQLHKAVGIKNVFILDWKKNFYIDEKKRIACIPFIRNIVEFTRGDQDPDFLKLTSLLHWKADSATITQTELDEIFKLAFSKAGNADDGGQFVVDQIFSVATTCLAANQGINFENKIVLSIAIRLAAERYMVTKVNDTAFMATITSNQTPALLKRYVATFGGADAAVSVMNRVALMTPENIHLNSFMYEPILDMGDDHLRKLFADVQALT